MVEGKVPVRGGAELFLKEDPSVKVGEVTSGVPAPSLGKPVGMAYCEVPHNKFKTQLVAKIRNKVVDVTVKKMPFVASNYHKV